MSRHGGCKDVAVPPSRSAAVRAGLAGLAAAGGGWLGLKAWPSLEMEWFAGGAARLAGLFTGVPVLRVETGWMLPVTGQTVVVTAACSATDFFLVVAALIGWRFARRGTPVVLAFLAGPVVALPLAIFINALRVVAVAQAHRWFIPLLPDAYGPFLHMITGVAVFLPALIGLNLLLELYGHSRFSSRR